MGRIVKLIGVAGLTAGILYLTKDENRKTVKKGMDKAIGKMSSFTDDPYIIQLGKPSESRDSNMVDEGAMTSVQYYNDLRAEKTNA